MNHDVTTRDARLSDAATRTALAAEQRIETNPAATQAFHSPQLFRGSSVISKPYSQHGIVYAALKATASNIAQVPFLIRAGEDEDDDTVLRDGPWVELFDRPNPVTKTRAKLWEQTILQMAEDRGESMWVKEGPGDEPLALGEVPTELWPMSGRFFDPVLDEHTKLPISWKFQPPGQPRPIFYEPHQLVLHAYTDPDNAIRGLGPLAPARVAYTADYKAAKYNELFFDNDATPGGLLVTEKPMSGPQRNAVRQAWDERHQGASKRRRVAMLEGGLTYQETGNTHREMEFGALRKLAWQEILAILGVPEYVIGLTENLNFATAQATEKGWWVKSLFPLIRLLEDGMWSQLFELTEGNQRSASHARSQDRARRMERAARPERNATRRTTGRYADHRAYTRGSTERPGMTRTSDIWGEFDLSTVEALRENFGEKVTTGATLRTMGYSLNAINERLDLGMEKLPPEIGDTSLVPATMTPAAGLEDMAAAELEATQNPPTPVVVKPGAKPGDGAENKPAIPAKDAEKSGIDLEMVRAKVVQFVQRRPADRERTWRGVIKHTEPLEGRFRIKFTRWLKELRDHQLKRIARWPHDGSVTKGGQFVTRAPGDKLTPDQIAKVLFEPKSWGQRLSSLEHGVYVDAAKTGIDGAINQLGGNFAFDVVDPRVVDVIHAREIKLAKVSDTVNKLVGKTLKNGVEQGETIAQLQERIKPYFNSMASSRSLMVARTEVAGAVNSARDLVYNEEGVESTQWITAGDEAVRDSHAEIDGDEAPIGTAFANGLKYPGDPMGEAGEVINCRCVAIPGETRAAKAAHQRQHDADAAAAKDAAERREYRVPEIHISVPPQPPAPPLPTPIINVAAPIVHVASTPPVVVPAPVVNVAPTPPVIVPAPTVTVLPTPPVVVPAPVVNVAAPIVNYQVPKRGPSKVEVFEDEDGEIAELRIVPEDSKQDKKE